MIASASVPDGFEVHVQHFYYPLLLNLRVSCLFSFIRRDEKVKRNYFKMLKREESKKVAAGALGNSNLEPLGERSTGKKEDPVTAKKMAAAFEARRKEAERKQKKVEKWLD